VIATRETSGSVSGRLAIAVLEWLIGSDKLGSTDLCLIRAVPGLDDEPPPEEIALSTGRRWGVTQVEGDFELRMRLVENGEQPLVAFTSADETAFGADLRERAALRYVIRPLARHTFYALIGADASALDDERFSGALMDVIAGGRLPSLFAAIRRRTWGNVIRESDAAAILSQAAFGFDDRYVESRSGELYARWLADPPLLTPSLYAFAIAILRQRYPLYADLLESTHDRSPVTAFREAAHNERTRDESLVRLARDAGRMLRTSNPKLLETLLAEAEAAYVASGSPLRANPLLHGAYRTTERALVHRAASDAPPSTDDVEALGAFLYFDVRVRDGLIALARLARGLRAIDQLSPAATLDEDAGRFRDHIAWLDRAARRLREAHFDDAECNAVVAALVTRWYGLRDALNLAFATRLAQTWPTLFAKPGVAGPLVVSHILKHVVRPALVAGQHVFLIVLDGCDVPTFLEIASALHGAGVPLPRLEVALSAIPTVTSHARRAIFAGKIPKDGLFENGTVVDPSGDRKAFEGPNSILEGFARQLFLKGDLGDDGEALDAALKSKDVKLIAAVFNDVDDAIASKEHGVLAERTIERCTLAFRRAVATAVDENWDIVLTADHGHTPYRAPDVKLTLAHPRYAELGPKDSGLPNTVLFESGVGSPYRIAAAHQLGAHSGPQHVGYHGGVSLEEMFVPLARFGRGVSGELRPPAWWDDTIAEERIALRFEPAVHQAIPAPNGTGGSELVARCRAVLAGDERLLKIFDRVRDGAPSLSASQLELLVGIPAARLRPFVVGLVRKLGDAGLDSPIVVEDDPLVFRWRTGA
jgi:hypothetical protein